MPRKIKALKPTCKTCKDTGLIKNISLKLPFNPGSPGEEGDVGRLITHLGLKMPKKRGEDRSTTEQKYLKRFAKKHKVFKTILDCREKKTAVSRYIYPTREDGRCGTVYGFHPSTWRKSSRAPQANLQNIPIRNKELAEAIRGTMVAAPGHVLVESDYEGIEAVIVGVCAGDKDYIKICKAGLHGFTAARWMGKPLDPNMPFPDLRRACKQIKHDFPEEYDRAKRGNHGVNYLLSAYGLHDEHQEAFPTQKAAQEYMDFYFGLFPKIRKWHNQTLELASRQTYLDNHFGVRHYFYSVYNFDKQSEQWKLGDDAKRAVAFVPQSDGSCIQNLDLLELAADPIIEPMLRLVIHDSKILEVPIHEVEYVCSKLQQVMSRFRPELQESIGVEINIGEDMRKSSMSLWTPPQGIVEQSLCTSVKGEAGATL